MNSFVGLALLTMLGLQRRNSSYDNTITNTVSRKSSTNSATFETILYEKPPFWVGDIVTYEGKEVFIEHICETSREFYIQGRIIEN